MDYAIIPTDEVITSAVDALKANNFEPMVVETGADALALIKTLIPTGVSVMNGASATLNEIGFIEYLKSGTHGWNNLHTAILAESDPQKQALLRKQSVLSDFYLGSVHGLSITGEMVFASNSGSQLPHLVFTSPNLILVVGAQKITPNLAEALKRLAEYVVPLEDARMLASEYKSHTMKNKTVILHSENPYMGRKVHVIIVKEKLGF